MGNNKNWEESLMDKGDGLLPLPNLFFLIFTLALVQMALFNI